MMLEIDDIYLWSTAITRRNGLRRRASNARSISSPNLMRSSGLNLVKSTKFATRQLPPATFRYVTHFQSIGQT